MQRAVRALTFVSFVSFVFASAAAWPRAAAIDARGRIDVVFLPDGRCRVSATGDTFHSDLTYTPHAAPQVSERRCAIPPVPDGTPVDLSVSLPPGASHPSGREDPPLAWTQQGDHWVGTAAMTTAPLVVRIPGSDDRTDLRARAVRTGGICAVLALAFAWLLWRRDRAA